MWHVVCSEQREITPEEQRARRAIFELQLDRMARREFSENIKLEIPDQLARLLAMPPQWFSGRDTYRHREEKESDFVDQVAAMAIGAPSLDEEFMKLYLRSEQADAMVDAWYYMLNASCKNGIDLSKVFDEVHKANMNKRDPITNEFIRRADGKVLKPPGWKPANIRNVVLRMFYQNEEIRTL